MEYDLHANFRVPVPVREIDREIFAKILQADVLSPSKFFCKQIS